MAMMPKPAWRRMMIYTPGWPIEPQDVLIQHRDHHRLTGRRMLSRSLRSVSSMVMAPARTGSASRIIHAVIEDGPCE